MIEPGLLLRQNKGGSAGRAVQQPPSKGTSQMPKAKVRQATMPSSSRQEVPFSSQIPYC